MESGDPDGAFLLREKVLDWTQETGLIPSVRVSVDGKIYNLHMLPLIQKSRYFKFHLLSSPESIELPRNFPGGCGAFERVGLFIYRSPLPFDPSSVAAVRCAAEFLGMTEKHAAGNLCERADLYLNQVILQSWDDTLTVLKRCQPLLPLSDKLLIVSRCVESIAFMASMEILDPDHHRDDDDEPTATLQRLEGGTWSSDTATELANRVPWIGDLVGLPFEFFRRVIESLRRQGMRETHVGAIVGFYANRWVLSSEDRDRQTVAKASLVLRGAIDLLLVGSDHQIRSSGVVIPVGFYFALLAKAIRFRLRDEYKAKVQHRIAALLHLARLEDLLLLLADGNEESPVARMEAVETIFLISMNVDRNDERERRNLNERAEVADLWDRFLSRIAASSETTPSRFEQLIQVVPAKDRRRHDHLYIAIDTLFLNHPELSAEDKSSICKLLNCQKLSQEACIEAVRNDRMPIRLTIRVLLAQQLSTHRAFEECSGSFRHTFPAVFSSSNVPEKIQPPGENSYCRQVISELGSSQLSSGGTPLGSLMLKDIALRRSGLARDEYESARLKVEMLEEELVSLKESMEWPHEVYGSCSSTATASAKSQGLAEVGVVMRRRARVRVRARGCVASLSWVSRRRFAARLVGLLRRLSMHARMPWGGKTVKVRNKVVG